MDINFFNHPSHRHYEISPIIVPVFQRDNVTQFKYGIHGHTADKGQT